MTHTISHVVAPPIYPITILCNPKGQWVALPYGQDDIDWPENWSDREEVLQFWVDIEGELMGYGSTPNDAVLDLTDKLESCGGYEIWAGPAKYRGVSAWGR